VTTPEEVLSQVSLFSILPKKKLARLAREAHDRTFPAGAVLTTEEQSGATFGVIVEGRAAVSIHGRRVGILGPGDYFGEMALIDHSYQSATVTAETELRCCCSWRGSSVPLPWSIPRLHGLGWKRWVQRVWEAEAG
jgi:CRP-like cAMP-binding protein